MLLGSLIKVVKVRLRVISLWALRVFVMSVWGSPLKIEDELALDEPYSLKP